MSENVWPHGGLIGIPIVPVVYTQAELLAQAKAAKMAEVNAFFKSRESLPVVFGANTFNGGIASAQMAKSKADMLIRQGEALGGAQPFPCTFNDINNVAVAMDTDELQDLAVVVGVAYETAFQTKATLKRDIAALTLVADIAVFDVALEWGAVVL